MPRKLTTKSVSTFVMEHGLDHALIDELPSNKIEDLTLAKIWEKTHIQVLAILKYLGLETEYNLPGAEK